MTSAKAFAAQGSYPVPKTERIRIAQEMIKKASDLLPSAQDAETAAKELDEAAGVKENSALATVAGESSAQRQARIQEATAKATDLSGLVRKKKVVANADAENGKRKLEGEDGSGGEGKKAKVGWFSWALVGGVWEMAALLGLIMTVHVLLIVG
jgi:hypothetical protein